MNILTIYDKISLAIDSSPPRKEVSLVQELFADIVVSVVAGLIVRQFGKWLDRWD